MSKKQEETTLAVQEEKALATSDLAQMFEEDAGIGVSDMTSQDVTIPFLNILQPGSPQKTRGNPKYVAGAMEGMLFNNVTGAVYPALAEDKQEGVRFIPCAYVRQVVEWLPGRKGLVAHHDVGDPVLSELVQQNQDGKVVTIHPSTGNVFVDTAYNFGLVVKEDGTFEHAIVTMWSTQWKQQKAWNLALMNLRGTRADGSLYPLPRFSHIFRLQTKVETHHDQNHYGWVITDEGMVPTVFLYQEAKAFALQVKGGKVKVGANTIAEDATAETQTASDCPF